MTEEYRTPLAYENQFVDLVREGIHTLKLADDGGLKPWWTGIVKYQTNGHKPALEVGSVFDVRTRPYPMGEHIGTYMLVAMSLTPEHHYALVGYADPFRPRNGAPVPCVDFTMLQNNMTE